MERLLRYWNQNKRKIIITIAVIAFVIIIIHFANYIIKNKKNSDETEVVVTTESKPTQSAITGDNVSEDRTDKNMELINQFVDYCNNKEYENAYNLLTDDCKQEYEEDVNTFANNYCKTIFKQKNTYDIELWINENNMYTYKVIYYADNLLATGGSSMSENVEEYITVIYKNNESKLNINGFITKQAVNKTESANDIEITINEKKIYKSYETYNITVKNNTSKKISLSVEQNNKDIYIIGKNEEKYNALLGELLPNQLSVWQKYEQNIDIKFNKIYDPYRSSKTIQFDNIILDENAYRENPNDPNIGKTTISIKL